MGGGSLGLASYISQEICTNESMLWYNHCKACYHHKGWPSLFQATGNSSHQDNSGEPRCCRTSRSSCTAPGWKYCPRIWLHQGTWGWGDTFIFKGKTCAYLQLCGAPHLLLSLSYFPVFSSMSLHAKGPLSFPRSMSCSFEWWESLRRYLM